MRCLALLALIPGLAFAAPVDGFFQNAKGTILHLRAASTSGFDFTLTAGATGGAATCREGATQCLQIGGHASAGGAGFSYIDPQDDHSRVFFAEEGVGMRVLSTTGDFGTGTANRGQMLALTGAFAKVDQKSDAVQKDGGVQAGNPGTDALHSFRSPTGNISCLFDVGAAVSVRCDMAQLNRSFTTPPKECGEDWGDSFGIVAGDARGGMICHGDTVTDPAAEVLDYGSTLSFGGVACVSARTGMTCQNAAGHGFSLSRKTQSLF